jgi:UDP-N-acetylglucosamine 2-epimerase (non-hydrolysing)
LSVFIVGTRAQLIKVAPAIVCCEQAGQQIVLLLTGQHQETMQDLIAEFGIQVRPELAVGMSERATVLALLRWVPSAYMSIARRLKQARGVHARVNAVVHGDTLSTLLGALAANRAGARVVHLESGLSSGRLLDPFPEEATRRAVFRLADLALCPSADTAQYMRARYACAVVDTGGNTIEDAVSMVASGWQPEAGDATPERRPYLVASLHRFQNIFDADRLRELVDLLGELATRFEVYFVLHPATRKRLQAQGLLERLERTPNLVLSPRLGYGDFLRLAAGAACVLTDGGSNQEELAVLGVPTIVMRQRTERSDGLGRNAVMEGEVRGGVAAYLLEGRYAGLRRPSLASGAFGPSLRVSEHLAGAPTPPAAA